LAGLVCDLCRNWDRLLPGAGDCGLFVGVVLLELLLQFVPAKGWPPFAFRLAFWTTLATTDVGGGFFI